MRRRLTQVDQLTFRKAHAMSACDDRDVQTGLHQLQSRRPDVGDWLHRALESHRIPKRLVGRRAARAVPGKLFLIFRDREELSSSPSLNDQICQALSAVGLSDHHLLAEKRGSRWVNEEILSFKRLGRADRILALIVDGEPCRRHRRP